MATCPALLGDESFALPSMLGAAVLACWFELLTAIVGLSSTTRSGFALALS